MRTVRLRSVLVWSLLSAAVVGADDPPPVDDDLGRSLRAVLAIDAEREGLPPEARAYVSALAALLESWTAPVAAAPDIEAATERYKQAFRACHGVLPTDEEKAAFFDHGELVIAWVEHRRAAEERARQRFDWVIKPLGGDRYRVLQPRSGQSFVSHEPVLDVYGADRYSTSSKNRPARKRPGDVIVLEPGDYPTFRLSATYDVPGFQINGKNAPPRKASRFGCDPITVIRAREPGTVRIQPRRDVGGTSTTYHEWAGAVELRDLILIADDRWAIGTEHPAAERWKGRHPGFRDLRFVGCDILGERDFHEATGPKNKWAVLCYEVGRSAIGDAGFVFEGSAERPARIEGIHREHAFYMHNTIGNDADADAVRIEHVHVRWCGRTFVQFTARNSEGPAGRGRVILRHCLVEDVCMEQGGGGSAITLAGNHDGTIWIEDVTIRLGADPLLHEDFSSNITGCFVGHHGNGSGGRDTREVVIRDSHFQVGPWFVGKHSARRPNMAIGAIRRFEMTGTRVLSHVGCREALSFDPKTLREVVLGADNDVRGDVWWGKKKFADVDRDRDGVPDGEAYRAFLRELGGEDGDGDGQVLDPSPVKVRVLPR